MEINSNLQISVKKSGITLMDVLWFVFLCVMNSHYYIQYLPLLLVFAITFLSILEILRYHNTNLMQQKLFVWYLLFFIWVCASDLWRVHARYGNTGVENEMFRLVLIFFSINVYCSDWEKYKKMMYMILYSTFYFSLVFLLTSPIETYGTTHMGGMTNIWRNTASYMTGCVGLLGFYLLGETKKTMVRISVIISIIGCYALLLCSGSRKGIIQLILYLVLFVLLQKGIAKKFKAIAVTVILVMLVVYIIQHYDFMLSAYVDRMMGLFNEEADDGSVEQREYFIEVGWNLFRQNPLIGAGVDAVRSYLAYEGFFHITYSHSNIVELFANYGIIGFILYYYVFVKKTLKALIYRSKDSFLLYASIALLTMFVCDYGMISYYVRQICFVMYFILKGIELKLE